MPNPPENHDLTTTLQAGRNWWQRQPRWRRITLYVLTVYIFLLKGVPWTEYKIHRWMRIDGVSLH